MTGLNLDFGCPKDLGPIDLGCGLLMVDNYKHTRTQHAHTRALLLISVFLSLELSRPPLTISLYRHTHTTSSSVDRT